MGVIIGEINGYNEGHYFEKRIDMIPSGFHCHPMRGICGDKERGAGAVVLSGGYVDDKDQGKTIVYTGEGGNDNGLQKADQTFESVGNASLKKSFENKNPVRVIRGSKLNSKFAPKTGYVYAGLYKVVRFWEETGNHGFKICRFELQYCGSNNKNLKEIYAQYQKETSEQNPIRVSAIMRELNITLEEVKITLQSINYPNPIIDANSKISMASYLTIKKSRDI